MSLQQLGGRQAARRAAGRDTGGSRRDTIDIIQVEEWVDKVVSTFAVFDDVSVYLTLVWISSIVLTRAHTLLSH